MSDADPIIDTTDVDVLSELRSKNWRDLNNIAIFDVETTKLNWNDPNFRIIQFTAGMYNLKKDKELHMINEYIDPELAIPEDSMKVHGLYHNKHNDDSLINKHGEQDVSDYRNFEQKMAKLITFMNKADLWCAYNHQFDVNCFASELKRLGYKPMFKPTIDPWVFEIERNQKMSGTTLWDAAKDYGVAKVSKNNLHDAEADVKLLKDVLIKMAGKLPQSTKSLFRQQTGYFKRQQKHFE